MEAGQKLLFAYLETKAKGQFQVNICFVLVIFKLIEVGEGSVGRIAMGSI